MNDKKIRAIAILACVSAAVSQAKSLNHLLPRSASNNVAMELVQRSCASNCKSNDKNWHGNLTVAAFHNQSFDKKHINGLGSLLSFGGSTTNSMTVGGGPTARAQFNIDGYQMGMNQLTDGSLTMKLEPEIYASGAHVMFFLGTTTGTWFTVSSAVGTQTIDPGLTETGNIGTQLNYATTVFGDATAITVAAQYKNMTEAFAAKTALSNNYKQMKHGKIDGARKTGPELAEINVTLGHNLVTTDTTTVGAGLCFVIPTGHKPTGEYALEPIFGNSKHFSLGGELFFKQRLWSSCEAENRFLDFYVNGRLAHQFAAEQTRSFDTTLNRDGSRYLLVARYNNAVIASTGGAGSSDQSVAQFQNEVANLINYSTLTASSTIAIAGTGAAMLRFNNNGWTASVGVEAWASAAEQLTITGILPDNLVILGRQVVRLAPTNRGFCQPNATMNSMLVGNTATNAAETADIKFAANAGSKIKQSDLNVDGSAHDARNSVKIFGHLGYAWTECQPCPSLGLTGSLECSTSKKNTASQWAIALQGSLCF
jgi:hypothetical protein